MHSQMNCYLNKEPLITLEKVNKEYEGNLVLKDISLTVRKGEFVSLIGPSGSGKSTLFNLISELEKPSTGQISVKNKLGYMQQKDLLLPWKTILENVSLPLAIKGEHKEIPKDLFVLTGLNGYEDKLPQELSGGMRQRASFLRTLLSSDELMLLDEPFGALDSITRLAMQQWLLETKGSLQNTIFLITHDLEEAIFLSDRIYVLSKRPGEIVKVIDVDFHKENKKERLLSPQLLELKAEILQYL